jgi:ribosomal protein S18 acetylase RimI-like enzyme
LEEGDAAAFRTVRLRALREDPDAYGSSYAEQVDRPLSYFEERVRSTDLRVTFGAFAGETLIGTVTFTRESGAKDRHKGVITTMYVAPEGRGQGLGRALLLAAIERARATPGVEQVHLGVVTTNTVARALYASVGFSTYGTEPHALKNGDGEYVDEDLMVLWLNPA